MSMDSKRNSRRIVGQRKFIDDENYNDSDTLEELFEFFIQAKEIEGLRERTITDHKRHFKYFRDFLKEFHPDVVLGSDV